MKKLLFLTCTLCASFNTIISQTTAAAKNVGLGNTASVRGVAVNGSELPKVRYVQDNTGGIAVYGTNLTGINRGDSVLITGPLTQYGNLYEITPATYVLISTGAVVPTPTVITPNQFSEAFEGMLIKVKKCTFNASGTFTSPPSGSSWTVTSNGQPFTFRINSASHPLVGTTIPTGTVDIVGIQSQYCTTPAAGCTTGYELDVRDAADITVSATVTTPTGIKEVAATSLISVFPNPTTGNINFKLDTDEEITSIAIRDILGKIVYQSTEDKAKIDVSNLSNGYYNLFISTGKNNYQTKFVKEGL